MSELTFLLKISRPRFWIYVFGPYLIGAAAAATDSGQLVTVGSFFFGVFFLFPANFLTYGINDIFDYETDKQNPKKDEYETRVSPEYRKQLTTYITAANMPFVVAAVLYFPQTLPALVGFLFFAIGYSAPPIRAKTKPLLDSLFNILYVFPGIFGYVLVSGYFPPVLAIVAAGSWTMAMHAFSAIPDIAADRTARVKTIATQLGATGTLIFCLVCYALSAVLSYRFIGVAAIAFGAAYLLMIALSYRALESDRLFNIYRFFPYLNTLMGFVLFWIIAYPKFS